MCRKPSVSMMALTTSMCGITLWVSVPAGVGMRASCPRLILSVSTWAMSALSGIGPLLLLSCVSHGFGELVHAVCFVAVPPEEASYGWVLHLCDRTESVPQPVRNLPHRRCLREH